MKHLINISSNADGLRLYNKKVYLTVVSGAANTGNTVNRTGHQFRKTSLYGFRRQVSDA